MAENETRVTYKAIADFISFTRAVDRAKRKLQELRKEEAALNASSAAGAASSAASHKKSADSLNNERKAWDNVASGMDKASTALVRHTGVTDRAGASSRNAARDAEGLAGSTDRAAASAGRAESKFSAWVRSLGRIRPTFRSANSDLNSFQRLSARATSSLTRLQKNLDRLRDWRPRLTPPFIALVPVIASVLALVNPLIAGLGSIGPVALGFASSLGSIGSAALGLAPILAGLLGTVGALRLAFGGIGGAFKAFGKTPAGGGGGGGGGGGAAKADKQIEISQTEKIIRAQEDYRRSIQDVQFAEEDLDDTRKDYIARVKELQKAVDRAAASEARASANSRLAQENYANVLADPGSTKGEKMDARVGVTEAQNDLKDVREEAKKNAKDLSDLKKTGINGDRQVIMSQRAVTDAVDAQRDAQVALQNAIKGTSDAAAGSGGGADAIGAYNDALDKLSPSARRFVEEIVAMKGEFDKMKRTVQEAFFSQFINDLQLIRRLFPPVTSMFSDFAGAAGRVVDRLIKLVTNDDWLHDIELFGKIGAPILEDIGDALLNLLDGFRNLTIAATPFLDSLAGKWKKSTANLRDLLAASRKDGSLAAYLKVVEGRMEQWWRIIKNVGKTLFNYSAAASDFGKWLTDGLEKMTEGWVSNSEDARKAGSGFQQYLEDLKPLLKEVKGLFGDFFGYLHDEATDPDNIKLFTDLVKIIRSDVGPALKRILDVLSKSGIGEALVKTLGAILDMIADFLENGGAEGMVAFFTTLTGFFKLLGDLVSAVPKPVIKFLTESFAVLAALTFVGLNVLIANLLRLGASRGLFALLKRLPGLGKIKGLFGRGAAAAAGGAAAAGRGVAGGAAALGRGMRPGLAPEGAGPSVFARGGGLFGRGVPNITSLPRQAGPIGKALGAVGSILKSAGGLVKKIGPRGAGGIAGIAGSIGGAIISDTAPKGQKGSTQRVTGNIVGGAASGAGIGATVGSAVPVIGTAVGAAVGGAVGGAAGFFTSKPEDKKKFLDDVGTFFSKTVPDFLKGLGSNIWDGLQSFGKWLSDTWDDAKDWVKNLPAMLGDMVGNLWGHLILFGDWLKETWDAAVEWISGLPQRFADTAKNIWDKLVTFAVWLGAKFVEAAAWIRGLPQRIADTAKNIWAKLITFSVWLAAKWAEAVQWVRGLPKRIADTARNIWASLPGILSWLQSMWVGAVLWFIGLPARIGQAAGNLWSGLKDVGQWLLDQGGKILRWANSIGESISGAWRTFTQHANDSKNEVVRRSRTTKNNGGRILRRAGGGDVPGHGNGDTVPAMLTPGEFVVRKAMVNRIGVENMRRLNSGLMSFGQMVSRAQQESPQGTGRGQEMGFFNAGGLVPQLSKSSSARMAQVASTQGAVSNDYSMNFGDIHVHNPIAEKSSESLPKAIRRASSLGSLRKDNR